MEVRKSSTFELSDYGVVNSHQSAQGLLATSKKLSFLIQEHQPDSNGTESGKEGS